MGKMYKINKSQLVNRKVFFSRVSIGEKNGRQSYELTAVSFFRRWRLLDLRSRTDGSLAAHKHIQESHVMQNNVADQMH